MGLFSWLRGRKAYLQDFVIGRVETRSSSSGVLVSPETAMRFGAVQACTRVISETIASLPLKMYERKPNGGKAEVKEHPTAHVVKTSFSPRQTSFVGRETMQAVTLLWGNSHARLGRGSGGRVNGIYPLRAGTWTAEKYWDDRIQYRGQLEDGSFATLMSDELLHVPGLGFDGIQGHSCIDWYRQAVGSGLAQDEFAGSFFGNGAAPSGVLSTDNPMTKEQAEEQGRIFNEAHKGPQSAGKLVVLSGGLKFERISIPPDDAQFIDSRKFSVRDIARMFRVPPHMIGDLEDATYSNIEHESISFVVNTIRPWLVRWEQELNRKLLLNGERKRFFFEFTVDGLLRGDIKTRYEAYAKGRQWGWLSVNDIRKLENMDPIAGGDAYLEPLNMVPVGAQEGENNVDE